MITLYLIRSEDGRVWGGGKLLPDAEQLFPEYGTSDVTLAKLIADAFAATGERCTAERVES